MNSVEYPEYAQRIGEYAHPHPKEGELPFDPLTLLFPMADIWLSHARRALSQDAKSHREVHVGATALMTNVEARLSRAYTGFNYTPFPGAPKYCAEMRSNGRGIADGFSRQELFIVSGPTHQSIIKSIVGRALPTLPPCAPCSDMLSPETLVIATGIEDNTALAWSGLQTKEFHKPVMGATRRLRAVAEKRKYVPEPFEIPQGDGSLRFWHNAAEEYSFLAKEADRMIPYKNDVVAVLREDLHEIRMRHTHAAIAALQIAAA